MRKMGAAFNPDRHCPYTGRGIYPHPYRQERGPNNAPPSWRLMFWRDDGEAMKCRECTAEESAWLDANPEAFAKMDAGFKAWRKSLEKIQVSR